ncbi:MAG: stage II sporulation protein M [Fibrella sp.]|nr:stage II sporulation protein M [Armatimonadota bacterium]
MTIPATPPTTTKNALNAPSTAALNGWIETRKPAWDNLARILNSAGVGRNGVRSLPRADLKSLGPLYRRTASDLAYARLRGADSALLLYLNGLVTRAHGTLYADKNPGWSRLLEFVMTGFPRLLRRKRLYVLCAALMVLLGGCVAAVMVAIEPGNLRLVVPAQFADNDSYYAERERNPQYNAPDEAKPVFAAGLMANNIRVAILAFAAGTLGGFPTLFLLFYNGMPLGGLAMQQHLAGRDVLFWSLILPHGVIELTAIIIGGAAGMVIGHALVAPGERTRKEALASAGKEAVRLLLGTVPLFIAAGFIEAFITPSALPKELKLGFAALTGIFLMAYYRAGYDQDLELTAPEKSS